MKNKICVEVGTTLKNRHLLCARLVTSLVAVYLDDAGEPRVYTETNSTLCEPDVTSPSELTLAEQQALDKLKTLF